MSYDQLLVHIERECTQIQVDCPEGCGSAFPKSQWAAHFEYQCLKVEVDCPECLTTLLKQDLPHHKCLKVLSMRLLEQ